MLQLDARKTASVLIPSWGIEVVVGERMASDTLSSIYMTLDVVHPDSIDDENERFMAEIESNYKFRRILVKTIFDSLQYNVRPEVTGFFRVIWHSIIPSHRRLLKATREWNRHFTIDYISENLTTFEMVQIRNIIENLESDLAPDEKKNGLPSPVK